MFGIKTTILGQQIKLNKNIQEIVYRPSDGLIVHN